MSERLGIQTKELMRDYKQGLNVTRVNEAKNSGLNE